MTDHGSAAASPLPTALLVERTCSVRHGQAGKNGREYSPLREVLIRIPAENEVSDGAPLLLLSPSSSSSSSLLGDGGCSSPSSGKNSSCRRKKRPWPWTTSFSGGGSPSPPPPTRTPVTTTSSEGPPPYDGPVLGGDESGDGGSGDPPPRRNAGVEEIPRRGGGAQPRQQQQQQQQLESNLLVNPDGGGGSGGAGGAAAVAPVGRDASTVDDDDEEEEVEEVVISREEGVQNQPSETDGSSSGPIPNQPDDTGGGDTPQATADDDGENSSSSVHWPIRSQEALDFGKRKKPHHFHGEVRDEEARYGRVGTKRGNGKSRDHGEDDDGEEAVVTRATRQQQQQQQQQQEQTVRIVIHEVLSEDFGLFTWPSGVVLACLVWARRREFRGANVVEIGAGTALPGLLAAKVGAAVALTDREGAPWVLENIRGAVAANGLTPTPDDATPPPADAAAAAAAAAAGAASAADVIVPGGLHDDTAVGDAAGTTEGARVEGCENKRKGSEEGERPKEAIVHAGKLPEGTCSVRELSWGRVGPAEMKLAREQWCPQVVLGADVFYSSEHFDSVLATAYMLLSATSSAAVQQQQHASGGGGGGCESAGIPTVAAAAPDATSSPVLRGIGDGICAAAAGGGAGVADHAPTPTSTATTPASAAVGATESTSAEASPGSTGGVADATGLGSPFDRTKCVFLTAYQERSARRSLRPLLNKWGMRARVLHNAPQQVLPPALWESGRYDSVALLEITLLH